MPPSPTSRSLWSLVVAHQAKTGASTTEIARRIGVTRQTLADWRTTGLTGRVPKRSTLDGLAEALGRPYRVVLEAALADAGYLDEDEATYESVMTDAVSALTAATELRRRPAADAPWRADRIDWGAFVCEAVASAAANGGGTDLVLSGRPGSWEAGHVEAILASTLGPDDEHLWDHRTKPIRVSLPLAGIVDAIAPSYDRDYQAADDALDEPYQKTLDQYDAAGVLPDRGALDLTTATADQIQEAWNAPTVLTAEEQELVDLDERQETLREQLRARRTKQLAEYGRRLSAAVEAELRAIAPASIPVIIETDPVSEPYEHDIPSAHVDDVDGLIEKAIARAIARTTPPTFTAPVNDETSRS